MLSPDEDGTPFTRPPGISGTVIGTAMKIETEHANETDEQPANIKQEETDTATKNEKDEPLTQTESNTRQHLHTQDKTAHNEDENDTTIEKVLYTHAHGHTCTRKNCDPIILSKRGIIRPNRPSTGHYHLGNVCSEGGEKLSTPGNQLITPKTEETEPPKHEEDKPPEITSTTTVSSDNITPTDIIPDNEPLHEKDEQTLEAADGLLMLQNVNTVNPANQEDIYDNSTLMPLADEHISDREKDEHLKPLENKTDNVDNSTLLVTSDEHLPDLEKEELLKPLEDKTASDDTIIYEPPELVTPPIDTPKQTDESSPKKGTLTIREVGIPKPGTSTEHAMTEVMPAITTAGKVRCDFCKRAFNTIYEQKQHMARRHLAQLQKKQEEWQCEKDEQKVQETENQHEREREREQNQKTERMNDINGKEILKRMNNMLLNRKRRKPVQRNLKPISTYAL